MSTCLYLSPLHTGPASILLQVDLSLTAPAHTGPSPSRMILNSAAMLLFLMAARHRLTTRLLAAPTRRRAARWIIWLTSLSDSSSATWLVARLSCSAIRSLAQGGAGQGRAGKGVAVMMVAEQLV